MFEAKLYGLTKGGGFKVWSISVQELDGNGYTLIEYGAEGGVMTPQESCVTKGKQGRNPYRQAVFEAESKVNTQLDKNYRFTKEQLQDLPKLPMLAENWYKAGHRMNWRLGVDLSDKLDGLRCLVKVMYCDDRQHNMITFKSRTGKPYVIPHIEFALQALNLNSGQELDGEIYYHGASLQDITSAVGRTEPQKEVDKINRDIKRLGADHRRKSKVEGVLSPTLLEELEHAEYIQWLRPRLKLVVFDIPNDKAWHLRLDELEVLGQHIEQYKNMVPRYADHYHFVEVLQYSRVFDEQDMFAYHDRAKEALFEGVMMRNRDGEYESGKRSADLQKYKRMVGDDIEDEDTEFLVVGMKADKNGNGIYVCKNDVNDLTFTVVWGSFADRLEALKNADKIINKKFLTVKYQTRYDRTFLPQFPCGKGLREGVVVDGEFIPSE